MTSKVDIKERIEYIVNLNSALLERSGYSTEAYSRVVLNTMVQTPSIIDCDTESLTQALLDAMNAGLVPDGKEAAIVPFKRRATLIIMIEGRLKLAQQATQGLVVRSMAVYAADEWDYAEGIHAHLDHVPSPTANQSPEHLIYVYATARMPGAIDPQYDVMSRATVDRYRAFSARADKPPWTTHFEEMAKNAVLKRLLKRLPKSSRAPVESQEFERVDTLEDAATLGGTRKVVDMTTGEIMEAEGPAPTAAYLHRKPKPTPKPAADTPARALAVVDTYARRARRRSSVLETSSDSLGPGFPSPGSGEFFIQSLWTPTKTP